MAIVFRAVKIYEVLNELGMLHFQGFAGECDHFLIGRMMKENIQGVTSNQAGCAEKEGCFVAFGDFQVQLLARERGGFLRRFFGMFHLSVDKEVLLKK